ncbi:MAG TPA: MerR family transcriptional regulator [Pseudomonas xinjiangensis]|uniref:MerR family transcriptional regulator n=2 Tax=root TaxID=1 RepID=A0A7V1BP26_9GAMM|nr:MerR family transcriptional regulator [Halopseudomonas xinjiangensis]HEC46322.1 MerR family transcriptional regulator [Halopseudomonas xinjiangensis]
MSTSAYTVGQLARATDTKAVTIRYYEQIGLLSSAGRTPSGYRIYTHTERDRLLFIRRARSLGFTLDAVRELLGFADQRDASCATVDAKVGEQLQQVRARIRDLLALERELGRLIACCQGGEIEQCRIIEALTCHR